MFEGFCEVWRLSGVKSLDSSKRSILSAFEGNTFENATITQLKQGKATNVSRSKPSHTSNVKIVCGKNVGINSVAHVLQPLINDKLKKKQVSCWDIGTPHAAKTAWVQLDIEATSLWLSAGWMEHNSSNICSLFWCFVDVAWTVQHTGHIMFQDMNAFISKDLIYLLQQREMAVMVKTSEFVWNMNARWLCSYCNGLLTLL